MRSKCVLVDTIGRPRAKWVSNIDEVYFCEGLFDESIPGLNDFKFIPDTNYKNAVFGNLTSKFCTRTVLSKLEKRYEDCLVGFEVEFYTNEPNSNTIPYCAKTLPQSVLDLWDRCEEEKIDIIAAHREYSEQQIEVVLDKKSPVAAVDELIRLYLLIAGEFPQFDLSPKPFNDRQGSGLHINLSFEGWQFSINNILAHHRELIALVSPSEESFKRMSSDGMTGWYSDVGDDNRHCTIRTHSNRFEYRIADNTCNPYLAVSALLIAADLEKKLEITVVPNRQFAFKEMSKSKIAEEIGDHIIKNYCDLHIT